LSVRTIRALEQGDSRPYRRTVTLLADALGLDAAGRAEFAAAARPAGQGWSEPEQVRPGEPAAAWPTEPDQGAPGGTRPDHTEVPRQLPAAVRGFVGRETELAGLTGLLRQPEQLGGTVVISAIAGTAGVGKTALAVRWAHQVAGLFPDGQLYVNLRGYDVDRPMPATDALAGFLRVLGVPGQDIPPEEDQRAARYRSLLAGRRMLVLLDNASQVEQVRPLLPGSPRCMVVVTSRDALAGLVVRDGARRLELDLLSASDAAALLRDLIGDRAAADPGATAALADLCARLPLALRVAAERAIASPSVPLSGLVAGLRDGPRLDVLDVGGDPRTAVRAVFSWSYGHLEPGQARTFRLIGLHPGPDLDVHVAAALTGSPAGEATRLLRALVSAYLVQATAGGRYVMHDLLRSYARELAAEDDGPAEERAALTRLLDHYLYTAAAAMDTLHQAERDSRPRLSGPAVPGPPVDTPAAALAWLDAQRACLVTATEYAAGHGWAEHAGLLAATLYRYLDAGGHTPEAITVHGHALRAARQTGDPAQEATALTNLGFVHAAQGCYGEAAGYLRQALTLYREMGERHGQAVALGNLGFIHVYQGRYNPAIQQLRQALTLHRETGNRIGEARTLNRLGSIDLRQGRYPQAARYLRQALALLREHGEVSDVGFALANLGRLDVLQGRYEQAGGSLTEALDLFRGLTHPNGEAYAVLYLGQLDLRLGRYPQAADHHQQALALSRVTGQRHAEAEALAGLGQVELLQGRPEQATAHLRQALALHREVGDLSGEAAALNGLGEALLAGGQPGQAAEQHQAALDLASQQGDRHAQAHAHNGLGQASATRGDAAGAAGHWRQALAIYTRLGVPEVAEVRAQLAGAPGGRRLP
jgi:tetratricopeptide (TPR) repeat protein